MRVIPTGEVDRALLDSWGSLAGVDEVGRGALAGPLAVGVVVVDRECGPAPEGVADSKTLRPSVREALVEPIGSWARASAIGWASPSEVSSAGVTAALRMASLRAFALVKWQLQCGGHTPLGAVLLDGKHDYLSNPIPALFGADSTALPDPWETGPTALPVATMVKADLHSQVVAAASIIAKVARDRYMCDVRDPGYGWASNKGYGAKSHLEGLASLGVSSQHRLGWRLPGVN